MKRFNTMFAKDTKIIMANKYHKMIQDVKIGESVKTLLGNKKVVNIKRKKEDGMKFIFSDGFKVIVTRSQEFLLPSNEWKKASLLKEGDSVAKPDSTSAKIVDVTPMDVMSSYGLEVEDNGSYILTNGMYVR